MPRHHTVRSGALLATLALWGVNAAGLGLRTLFGLLIGGYLMLWFAVSGAFSLLLAWTRPALPSRRAVLGRGLLGQAVWCPFSRCRDRFEPGVAQAGGNDRVARPERSGQRTSERK